jgi:hypothetical protein
MLHRVSTKRTFSIVLFGIFVAVAGARCRGAEWQWSAVVESVVSQETNEHPRAFLWVPPNCERVRGAVVGQHNMLEEGVFEHPLFRKTMSDLCLAEVWVTPPIDLVFRFDQGAGEHFERMLTALARESGYEELASAPVVPIGHSAAASYPWNFAAWNPNRTLAVISLKGDAPLTNLTGSGRPNPDWGMRNIDGIPGLMVMGEYEWWVDRLTPAAEFRAKHPATPLAMLADVGRGHFDISDDLVSYLGMFIRKAVERRLPAKAARGAAPKLRPVDPRAGWLVDIWREGVGRKTKAAPFGRYAGDPKQAFWAFDGELARATENYRAGQIGKSPQLLGYVQDGAVVPQAPKTHAQVTLHLPPLDESLGLRLTGAFLDTVPPGNPEKWAGLPAGATVGHAKGGGPVRISRITGPVVQTGPDTFAVRFNRVGFDNARRSGDVWLLAEHEGDDKYKSAVQQANLRVPLRNEKGAEQRITFPEIPNQKAGAASLKLSATSDAGVPVYYYVREGPAEVEGNVLRFTRIPLRSRFPLKVMVVAWQWGRTVEPQLKSATPVERTFFIGN